MGNRRSYWGINLIELLIGLGIIILLVLISVPLLMRSVQNFRLSGTADNLYNYLQYARTEAIKQNTAIFVAFTSGNNWCYGLNSGSACNCSVANSCNLGVVNAPNSQLSLSATGLSGNNLSFEPTHAAASAISSITFTISGKSSLITINIGRFGNMQMCANELSGYSAC